jgi:hypothetical protein
MLNLKKMHAESRVITDPIEKASKFTEIQVKDEQLDSMDESNRYTKKELQNFRLTFQAEYV